MNKAFCSTSVPPPCKNRGFFAGMVELVDSVDLGSTAKRVQVRVLLPAPIKKHPFGGVFFIGIGNWTRTHLNAEVRWTSAKRRLDGVCSIASSSPVARMFSKPEPI